MNTINRFNLRVYGIMLNEFQEVLLSDELVNGMNMTKFPGGGVEFGEGVVDALIREWKEEADLDIEVIEHFYTTESFVPSFLKDGSQVISIYYLVEAPNQKIDAKQKRFDFTGPERQEQFRWAEISTLNIEEITFPIDRLVTGRLRQKMHSR